MLFFYKDKQPENPSILLGRSTSSEEVVLPSIDGDLKVLLPVRNIGLISSAHAQTYYYYNSSYQEMAYYQGLRAYQQALMEWRRQLAQYQIQRYQWIQQQQIQALSQVMNQYSNYQIGRPKPWDHIRSIYGFAVYNDQPTLFGVNSKSKPVEIKKTV